MFTLLYYYERMVDSRIQLPISMESRIHITYIIVFRRFHKMWAMRCVR